MRVLFLTSLYSTQSQPARSPPNARIASAMRRTACVKVIAPLPYYPERLTRGRPDLEAIVSVPARDLDADGEEVLHPRYVHVPKVGRALYPALYAASVLELMAETILSFRPHVVMSAWAFPDGVAAVALSKLFGLPSVLRIMGSDINVIEGEHSRQTQIAWALRHATRVVAVSAALGKACADISGAAGNIDVIPTGVDNTHFFPVPRQEALRELNVKERRRLIVVPARLSREKGVHYFIDAFAKLDRDVIAVLVGDGPELPALRERAAARGVEDRVIFAGYQNEVQMRAWYSAADLVCLPSTEEGWPNVLIESYACGCPWVASDVGGVSEVRRLADGGILARPGDSTDLADRLREGLARQWDRVAIAAGGASLSILETGNAYVAACRAAVGAAPRRAADHRAAGQTTGRASTASGALASA